MQRFTTASVCFICLSFEWQQTSIPALHDACCIYCRGFHQRSNPEKTISVQDNRVTAWGRKSTNMTSYAVHVWSKIGTNWGSDSLGFGCLNTLIWLSSVLNKLRCILHDCVVCFSWETIWEGWSVSNQTLKSFIYGVEAYGHGVTSAWSQKLKY